MNSNESFNKSINYKNCTISSNSFDHVFFFVEKIGRV